MTKKRNQRLEESEIEINYEKSFARSVKKSKTTDVKSLLPIKTKTGLVRKQIIKKLGTDVDTIYSDNSSLPNKNICSSENDNTKNNIDLSVSEPTTTVQLLAHREKTIALYKYKIGLLSSEILENPMEKITNVFILLKLMEERSPDIYITIRKLVCASLLEIFKDILPSYSILSLENHQVKLKKETLQLQKQEALLLKYYKQYLLKLEKMSNVLKKKQYNFSFKKEDINLGTFALTCMSDLIIAKPYFNFSANIAHFLLPFLDHKLVNIRKLIADCFKKVFREDKRGELSLIIVRRLNKYIKMHKTLVHTELITVLKDLRIKNINLDKEKYEENKYKKLDLRRRKLLTLSKKERKKKNLLEKVEKEILETKAEENSKVKNKAFTEILSIVFMIYFRILKETSNNQILSSCLEGLSIFSHCINIDYYQDLLNILCNLLNDQKLTLKSRLYCIQSVFLMLSGQTATLNLDPNRFYIHLYQNLFAVNNSEIKILIKILCESLVQRGQNITQNRLLAFIKKISTLALCLQHNCVLGIMYIFKLVLQNHKAADILLDTDNSMGTCLHTEKLNNLEYCNGCNSTLWEIIALQRYYHPVVKVVAENVLHKVPHGRETSLPIEMLKLSPDEVYEQYDPSDGKFKPSPAIPKPLIVKNLHNPSFTDKFNNSLCSIEINNQFKTGYFNLFKEIKENGFV